MTMRRSLDARAELIWNTALVEVICEQTLRVADMFGTPETTRERISRTSRAKFDGCCARVASSWRSAPTRRRAA
jgi:hypothetical protein